jgi:hypothetical protein
VPSFSLSDWFHQWIDLRTCHIHFSHWTIMPGVYGQQRFLDAEVHQESCPAHFVRLLNLHRLP